MPASSNFSDLGLNAHLTARLDALGYLAPTDIQAQTIPLSLQGKDVIALAQTGSGKTAGFALPIIQSLNNGHKCRAKRIRSLILCPTRELAKQLITKIEGYLHDAPLTTLAVYGGVPDGPQKQKLIEGVDILVATPGRLRDLLTQRALHLDEVKTLVLDEGDKMLDMGFIDAISDIMDRLPAQKQCLLFSATMPPPLKAIASDHFTAPITISTLPKNRAATTITQWLTPVDKDKKSALLSQLLQQPEHERALIFIQTKHGAAKLVSQLEKRGIAAEAFHSGRSQDIREKLIRDFSEGKLRYLVATGVVARGIDIDNLNVIINYDLPFEPDDYIHRIGRTGRAGKSGTAISFVSKDDFKNLCAIERRLQQIIERRQIEGFEPNKPLPKSDLNFVPKARKPKAGATPDKRRPNKTEGQAKRKSDGKPNTRRSDNKKPDSANRRSDALPINPWAKHKKS